MNDRDALLKQIDVLWHPVVTGARDTVRHLKEWTGELPGAVAGAAPSASAPVVESDDDERGSGSRTPGQGRAEVKLRAFFAAIDRMVLEVGELAVAAGLDCPPSPARRLEAQVSWVQWQINEVRRAPGRGGVSVRWLERLVGLADHAHRLVVVNARPTAAAGVPAGGCAAHARAGEFAEIDDRYRRKQLCRRCGDFLSSIGHLPPPKLVKWGEKHGWRSALAPATLARFNIQPRRPKRR